MSLPGHSETRVAVLVDCDNISPDAVEYALKIAAQFGRIVLRRGYGNHTTLASRWQETLVKLAFTPCLQYQYAAKKNTSDIALALDAQEALFDARADVFCLVTSDSDFAYLCRKLRERGASVCIIGESKTPDALRNASDQFFEWSQQSLECNQDLDGQEDHVELSPSQATDQKPAVKSRPRFVIDAVSLLAGEAMDGRASLGAVGSYLKRTDPGFSPTVYGYSGLLEMMKTYAMFDLRMEPGGHWTVSLAGQPVQESV